MFSQNVVWEQVKDPSGDYYECMKRDGTTTFLILPVNEEIAGMFYSAGLYNRLFVVTVTGRLYEYDSLGTLSATWAVGAANTYRFTEFQFDNGQVTIIIANTTGVWWTWNPGSAPVQITDPDFPFNVQAYPVFLDGYLFAMDINGVIYNSDLNASSSWTAGNNISAESYPDQGFALARNGQYIVAFGQTAIQFFYDAGNPTGTPLALQTTVHQVGFIGGLMAYGESLYFIGETTPGQPQLFKLTGLQIEAIAAPPVTRRLVDSVEAGPGLFYVSTGSLVHFNGYPHYIPFCTSGLNAVIPMPMYNLLSQTWTYFVMGANTYQTSLTIGHAVTMPLQVTGGANPSYTTLFSVRDGNFGSTNNQVFRVDADVYQDSGVNYTSIFRTQNLDYGTRRLKFGSRLLTSCDQTPSTSFMTVRWTVDDYQTYSDPRTVDLSLVYPNLPAIGQFRKIAFEFSYTANFPMRWTQSELDYNLGGQ